VAQARTATCIRGSVSSFNGKMLVVRTAVGLGPASALGTRLAVAVLASMLLANKLLGRTRGSLFRMV